MDGIAACNRAHRDESHGDVTWVVSRGDGCVRIVETRGYAAYAAAQSRNVQLEAQLAELDRKKKGIVHALSGLEEGEEIVGQLRERLARTEDETEKAREDLYLNSLIPQHSETVKYVKV